MADRPILFSAPMVCALLDGRKTMTRRILKPRGADLWQHATTGKWFERHGVHGSTSSPVKAPCAPGDRLWVKEPYRLGDHLNDLSPSKCSPSYVWYEADGKVLVHGRETNDPIQDSPGRYRHARFMPRWASRLTLIVTDVRVQRLQDISEEDARAEGVFVPEAQYAQQGERAPVLAFAGLWESINGPGAWKANPWVVALTFRVIKRNIDEFARDAA
jgi:hypothetical protein